MEACANGCDLAAQALLQQQEIDVNMQDKVWSVLSHAFHA